MNDLIFASAKTIADSIQSKTVSALEVVEAHLNRIAKVNPHLNAVVQLTADTAIEQAQAADQHQASGKPLGPLHGVPMTIKDSFNAAGVISTWGTPGRAHTIPTDDATVVKRLKTAGAILLGKTNTPEFTLWGDTINPVYGRTSNPYDLTRSPAGSSGGAAAIIAAGGSPFDIGTDTRGSIRQPAHYCGITGIRPTSGRVPRTGHAIGPGGLVDFLTQAGPMARFVSDLALILPIISGPDGRDFAIAPVPMQFADNVNVRTLRYAFYTDNGIETPQPEIIQAVLDVIAALRLDGIQPAEQRPPHIETTAELFDDLMLNWDGGAWRRWLLDQAGTALEETSLRAINSDRIASPDQLVRTIARWDQFRHDMLAFMDDYEVIIAPVNTHAAIPKGQMAQFFGGFNYTGTYNLTGWPAACVPVKFTENGLPIGVQIIAKPWREDIVLAVAQHIEQIFGGWKRPPL